MMRTLVLFFLSGHVRALSIGAPARPTAVSQAASRAPAALLLAKDSGLQVDDSLLREGAKCTFLDERQRGIVRDLLGRDASEQDTLFECDMPANDCSLTCFLLPDSWHMDPGATKPKWLCMSNPHPTNVAEYEDGY